MIGGYAMSTMPRASSSIASGGWALDWGGPPAIRARLGPPGVLPALAAFLPTVPRDVRVAVEFRHRGWVHDGVLALLAEHNVAFVLTDTRYIPRRVSLSLADRPTADFAYIRWNGTGP